MYWGAWAVAARDVEKDFGLSHAMLGATISVALLGAAFANAIGGALTERRGTARLLSLTLVIWGSLVLVVGFAPAPWVFIPALFGVVTVGGLLDVVMNVAATAAYATRPGALVRFHAFFNSFAAIGAMTTGLLIANQLSWRWTWRFVAIAACIVGLLCMRAELPAGTAGESVRLTSAMTLIRRERLTLLATAFALGATVEGGIEVWGVLFLRTHVPRGLLVGATSAAAGYTIAAAARVFVGPSAGRRGAARGVFFGCIAAAIGILLLGLVRIPFLAGFGLVMAAGGISMCWPLLLAHATKGNARPAAIVGGMTSIGYLGFVIGPAILGAVAQSAGLRIAVLLLAGVAAYVAISVRFVQTR